MILHWAKTCGVRIHAERTRLRACACVRVGMNDTDGEGCGWWVRLGADVLRAVRCGCRWWSTQVRVKK